MNIGRPRERGEGSRRLAAFRAVQTENRLAYKVITKLTKIWMRFVLRGVAYRDNHKKLNAIYLVPNPWRLDSPGEQYRFAETNRLISENFGRVGSLLEIGCGEGHQSLCLLHVCDRLIGLDVSIRAVERARKMCPSGQFSVGDIFSKVSDTKAPFDLVVGCEVLYYMSDVSASLRRMQVLGRNCLVSYWAGAMRYLDPQVLSLPGVVSEIIRFQNTRWRVAWWPGLQS